MKIPAVLLPRLRLATVLLYLAFSTIVFFVLWARMGGQLGPLTDGYRVKAQLSEVQNLAYDSDVRIAGVLAGKIRDVSTDGTKAVLVLQMKDDVGPLHEGATLRLRSKTLVEETYLEVVDGTGKPIPDGGALPATAELESVQLDDVLRSLDAPTRAALSSMVQSMNASTVGRDEEISQVLSGLGDLGREGKTALDALAAHDEDLTALTRQTAVLLAAVDGGQGEVAELVRSSEQLAAVSSRQKADLEASVRQLPDLTATATDATQDLRRLATALAPVAADLRAASPDLDAALVELPAAAEALRASLPAIQQVLDRAPATLTRTPVIARQASSLVGPSRVALADLNPMLNYLEPYGADVSAFFTNLAGAFRQSDPNGHYWRVFAIVNEQSLKGLPYATNVLVPGGNGSNAYQEPGGALTPVPFTGTYPRVVEDPE